MKSFLIIERKRLMPQTLPDEVIKKVAKAFGTKEEIVKERGRKDNIARKAAIYFIQRYSGLSNEAIGKLFGEYISVQ
jgi:chromosomal replication initiation ATPase DnaA